MRKFDGTCKISLLMLILAAAATISCSDGKYPSAPAAPGKVSLNNESGHIVIIESFTHERGSASTTKVLNAGVVNRGSYTFQNLLDHTNSRYFAGGDMVEIR